MFYHLKRRIKIYLSRRRILKLIKSLRPQTTNFDLIRFGGNADGGYLLPDDLKGIKACFSPGVGNVSDFEYNCAEKGMSVFMADGSVEAPSLNDYRFNFQKKYIGNENRNGYITLEEWIKTSEISTSSDLLLQMDIEGSEFEVLNSSSFVTLKQFRIMIIEFHNLHLLSDSEFYKKAISAFGKILKNHICVHIHPNNCCGIRKINGIEIPVVAEFTFIRKDRITTLKNAADFPHQLDRNNTGKPTLNLPSIWYEN